MRPLTPLVLVSALALASSSAAAGQRAQQARPRDRGAVQGEAVPRGESRRDNGGARDQSGGGQRDAQREAQAPPPSEDRRAEGERARAGRQPDSGVQQNQRPESPRREPAPRAEASPRRAPQQRAERGPDRSNVAPPSQRRDDRRDYPRTYGSGSYGNSRPSPRVYNYPSRSRAPRYYVPRHYNQRPYTFRPRTRLSLGIYLGYGFSYGNLYPYPVPVYGYNAPSAPVYITPYTTSYGGILLDITPQEADVFVDGEYVGQVADFDGTSAPLSLMIGRHHIEVAAAGYDPLIFEVDVTPGQLVPYRGDLQPSRW